MRKVTLVWRFENLTHSNSHIASGKWSIPDLIGYFVSIKDTLTKDEMEKLKRTNMFFAANAGSSSAEPSATPKRFLASQLHEPSAENIALGIPVLDWNGGEWDPRSPSAQFSFSIGLLKVRLHPCYISDRLSLMLSIYSAPVVGYAYHHRSLRGRHQTPERSEISSISFRSALSNRVLSSDAWPHRVCTCTPR